jgi:hypothetical protein
MYQVYRGQRPFDKEKMRDFSGFGTGLFAEKRARLTRNALFVVED